MNFTNKAQATHKFVRPNGHTMWVKVLKIYPSFLHQETRVSYKILKSSEVHTSSLKSFNERYEAL